MAPSLRLVLLLLLMNTKDASKGDTHVGNLTRWDALQPAEKIFPDDPNSPAPIQQNTQPAATDRRYENGQIFGVTASGVVTAARFYVAAAEAGP